MKTMRNQLYSKRRTMIRQSLAFLTALVLLPLSLSLAEEETETISGPVAKTVEELNAMLDSADSVTTMIDEPFYENVTDENAALDAMGSVTEQLGCDDTTILVLDTVRSTEDGLTVYTFRQQAGDLAVYGGVAKLIVDKNGTAVAAVTPVVAQIENIAFVYFPYAGKNVFRLNVGRSGYARREIGFGE